MFQLSNNLDPVAWEGLCSGEITNRFEPGKALFGVHIMPFDTGTFTPSQGQDC